MRLDHSLRGLSLAWNEGREEGVQTNNDSVD